MDLEHHPAAEPLFLKSAVHGDHRHLYDVGGCALDGRVHCIPLGQGADCAVFGIDFRNITPSSEYGFHIAGLAGRLQSPVDERPDRREACKVVVDDASGLASADFQPLCKTEG